jgi:oligoendopeptidase F
VDTVEGLLAYLQNYDSALNAAGVLRTYVYLPTYLDTSCDRSEYNAAYAPVANGIDQAYSSARIILLASSDEYRAQILSDESLSSWRSVIEEMISPLSEKSEEIDELNQQDLTYLYSVYNLFENEVEYPTVTASDGTTVVADYNGYVASIGEGIVSGEGLDGYCAFLRSGDEISEKERFALLGVDPEDSGFCDAAGKYCSDAVTEIGRICDGQK